MAASSELNRAKENLAEALGDHMKKYLQNMNMWFRQKLSRENFDVEARKMLTLEAVHLHNEFLLAILTKCQSLTSTLAPKDMNAAMLPGAKLIKKGTKFKKKPIGRSSSQRFQPVDPMMFVPKMEPPVPEEPVNLTFCSREMCLPDVSMVHGRMYVSAWDAELVDVQDEAVKLVMEAVQIHLKNILSSVISRRKGYHLREGRFRYAAGDVIQPYLRNSALLQDSQSEATDITSRGIHVPCIKPSIEVGQGDAAKHVACSGHHTMSNRPMNLYDLFDALQVEKSVIPSHTVYSLCMERILSRLWHPSESNLKQEHNHRQEVTLKRDFAS